jgi:hypothetical protein
LVDKAETSKRYQT